MAVVPEVSAESTDLFVGPEDALRQVVRVHLPPGSATATVRIDGDGLACDDVPASSGAEFVEVGVTVTDPTPGRSREARVAVGDASAPFTFVDAEPGWTMYMISHFHYDPVWWNTQAAYTSTWTEDPPGRCRQTNGFDLVAAHLDMARREPEYKFVLAEVDYLKPYWDARPEDRAELRRMIADGRVEVMGGTYNEPNT
ncbi:MAG: glycoside hydrolase, family 38, partial [Mycobacterium sp.]|nr:glycoside hydrolase, family 38 [Mycobacterium sp.]